MAEKFDELAKNLATQEELPRRRMLGQLAAAMGGGLVALFAGERSAAAAPPVKCPPGLTTCDGVCRDTAVNADHCGTCGNVCAAGEMCRSGVCVACTCAQPCPSGQTSCGGRCVNLQTDPAHCGSCTTVCASGQVCTNGQCSTGCPSGQTNCGGTCVTLGQSCNTGRPGICASGVTTCQNGEFVCTSIEGPRPETCNGLDDDCDGVVDNGFPTLGQSCDCGGGRSGVVVCSPDGTSTVCLCV